MADFDFVPQTKDFNAINALAMGKAARPAYKDEQTLKDVTFRFRNNNDAVTRVPVKLRAFPYQHIGSMRYFNVNGQVLDTLSWWASLLDRLRGRVKDLGKPGTDGMKDHFMDHDIELLERNLKA